MKKIDLRNVMGREGEWWVDFLAYQASIPRNWIERKLEPLVQKPGSPLRIIDAASPAEEGVANGYPTAGMSVWWVIVCMDGAPERMQHQVNVCEQPERVARDILAFEENRFRALIVTTLEHLAVQPLIRVFGNWRDGKIVGYETREAATKLVAQLAKRCAELNSAAQLPWNRQFHVRAGMGLSVREAFSGLLGARRDQLCCAVRQGNKSSWDSGCETTTLPH